MNLLTRRAFLRYAVVSACGLAGRASLLRAALGS